MYFIIITIVNFIHRIIATCSLSKISSFRNNGGSGRTRDDLPVIEVVGELSVSYQRRIA